MDAENQPLTPILPSTNPSVPAPETSSQTKRPLRKRLGLPLSLLAVLILAFLFRVYVPGYGLIAARFGSCNDRAFAIARHVDPLSPTHKLKFCEMDPTSVNGRQAYLVYYRFHDNFDFEDPFYCQAQKSCATRGIIDVVGKTGQLSHTGVGTFETNAMVYGCESSISSQSPLPKSKIIWHKGQYMEEIYFHDQTITGLHGQCTISGYVRANEQVVYDGLKVHYSSFKPNCDEYVTGGSLDLYNCIVNLAKAKSNIHICDLYDKAGYKDAREDFPTPKWSCYMTYAIDRLELNSCDALPQSPQGQGSSNNQDSCKTTIKERSVPKVIHEV